MRWWRTAALAVAIGFVGLGCRPDSEQRPWSRGLQEAGPRGPAVTPPDEVQEEAGWGGSGEAYGWTYFPPEEAPITALDRAVPAVPRSEPGAAPHRGRTAGEQASGTHPQP
jgi:hypothetical protein